MQLYSPENTPQQNLEQLRADLYPGRGIVAGFIGDKAVQACYIGGRSEGSRNRIYRQQDDVVFTEVFDKSNEIKRPDLTIYEPMRRTDTIHIVSNGDQTLTALQFLRCGMSFREAMESSSYEDDGPIFTPRISAFTDLAPKDGSPRLGMSLIRKVAVSTTLSIHDYFDENSPEIDLQDGVGYALQTYKEGQDGQGPAPSYDDAPYKLPLEENAEDMAQMLWDNLRPVNRGAVAAKTIDQDGNVRIAIINSHTS